MVEESLSAGQAILKFESESAAFAAAASVESLCRNVQEKTVQGEEQEEETSSTGEMQIKPRNCISDQDMQSDNSCEFQNRGDK